MDFGYIVEREGYRYEDLTDENKGIINLLNDFVEDIDSYRSLMIDIDAGDDAPLHDRLYASVANEVLDGLKEWMRYHVLGVQTSLAENQPSEGDFVEKVEVVRAQLGAEDEFEPIAVSLNGDSETDVTDGDESCDLESVPFISVMEGEDCTIHDECPECGTRREFSVWNLIECKPVVCASCGYVTTPKRIDPNADLDFDEKVEGEGNEQ